MSIVVHTSQGEVANKASAPALYFDGSGGRVYSTLTNQTIGTDDTGYSCMLDVPSANPSATYGVMALSSSSSTAAQANALVSTIDTSRNLLVRIYGATASAYKQAALSLVAWSGKSVFVQVERIGDTIKIRINGVDQTSGATVTETAPWTAGVNYLRIPGVVGEYWKTASAAANKITGDITVDVHVKGSLAGDRPLVSKYGLNGNRSWAFNTGTAGLQMWFSTDGTTVIVGGGGGGEGSFAGADRWWRATRRVSDGVTRFFWSADGAAWTKTGGDLVISAGNAIFDSTADLLIGERLGTTASSDIRRIRLYDGFEGAGDLKVEMNAEDATDGTSNFVSSTTGETWSRTTASTTTPVMAVVESTTWSRSITNTYFTVGLVSSTVSFRGRIWNAGWWNISLTDAEALTLYEDGGTPPYHYRWAGTSIITGNSSTFEGSGSWSNNGTATMDVNVTVPGKLAFTNLTGGAAYPSMYYGATSFSQAHGRRLRLRLKAQLTAGTISQPINSTFGGAFVLTGTEQTFEVTFSPPAVAAYMYIQTASGITMSVGAQITLDDITLTPVGAVLFLPLDDGIGYQAHDRSTNKLDGVITTSGVTHTVPQRRGYVRTPGSGLTWAATHEAKSLLGVAQQALPSTAVIERITTKATADSSGSGLTVGATNAAARWVAANTFTTAKENHALAATLPAASAAADLDLLLDPDTANYTGTIAAEVHYVVTEGAP